MEPNRDFGGENRSTSYHYGRKKKKRGGFLILWALIFSLIGGAVGSVVTYKYMPKPAVSEGLKPQVEPPADKTRKHEAGVVESEEQTKEGSRLNVLWTRRQRAAFEALDGADRPEADEDGEDAPLRPSPGGWDPLGRDDRE